MYSDLFFLFSILLLITLGQNSYDAGPSFEMVPIFKNSVIAYLTLLFVLSIQTPLLRQSAKWTNEKITFLTNLECIGCLIFLYFYLEVPRLLPNIFPLAGFTLFFYFLTLFFSHYCYERLYKSQKNALKCSWNSIRILVPTTFPFLILSLIVDTGSVFFCVLSVIGLVIFYPAILIRCWHCTPIVDNQLNSRLNMLCKKAKFKCAGFKTWSIMKHSSNAAIIGMISKCRYIMLTKSLIDHLSLNAIEAVVAHEIGHQKHGHLFLYPLILMGMVVVSLSSLALNIPFAFTPILFIGIAALYYRVVFGYFSRLFERQADLYIFALQLNPNDLIDALKTISAASGTDRNSPNWHHFSIQQRIDFIEKCKTDTTLYTRHERYVKYSLGIYLLFIIVALLFLFAI